MLVDKLSQHYLDLCEDNVMPCLELQIHLLGLVLVALVKWTVITTLFAF